MRFADQYFKAEGVKDYIYPQMVQDYKTLTDDEIRRTKALYYGYVTFVDKWIGYLLSALTDLGLWEDTVICFVSDHGTELMDHNQFGKTATRCTPITLGSISGFATRILRTTAKRSTPTCRIST